MDWEWRSNTMATMFTGLYPSGLFLFGYVKNQVYSTPVPDIDWHFESKDKERFRGGDRTDVGENMERNQV
jgi:hypothetical protein